MLPYHSGNAGDGAISNLTACDHYSNDDAVYYPTEMRTTPALTVSAASHFTIFWAGSSYTATLVSGTGFCTDRLELIIQPGSVAGDASWIRLANSSGYLDLDAGL